MKYGYARVSTDDQTPALQLAALKKAGCKTIFKDNGLLVLLGHKMRCC
jgi:DNA invertase Pin-like site-specific DNA recombinase